MKQTEHDIEPTESLPELSATPDADATQLVDDAPVTSDTPDAPEGTADSVDGNVMSSETDERGAAEARDDAGDAEDTVDPEQDAEFEGILEALIFASDEPLTFKQIKELLAPEQADEDEGQQPGRASRRRPRLTITRVKRIVDTLNLRYEESGRAFRIIEVSGGFAFQTTAEYGAWVGRLFAERSRRRLTQSALETLAIIAFKQPISKPAIEGIRGVNADHVVKSLLERNLISIVGREDSPGRPLLYGTTKTFLKHFGLSSINDLPKPREISELLSSDDDLASNPIEEMDPEQAMKLSDMSSQELERLFDTARIKGAESNADADSAAEDDNAADSDDTPTDDDANARLRVTLDTGETEEPSLDGERSAEMAGTAVAAEDDAVIDTAPDASALDEIPEELRLYEQLMRDANGASNDAHSPIDDGEGDPFGEEEDDNDDNPLDRVDEDEEDDENEFADDDSDIGGDPFAREEEEFANGDVEADIEVENPFDEDAPDEDEEQR